MFLWLVRVRETLLQDINPTAGRQILNLKESSSQMEEWKEGFRVGLQE